MSKYVILHYMKFTREARQKKWDEFQKTEFDRYNDLLKKHGLKMLNHGVPFGNEYHSRAQSIKAEV